MALIAYALIVVFSGCGSNSAELKTAPVSGLATLDGVPVASGTVLFSPQRGRAGHGTIQADGSFVISTYREGDGAVVGKNRIAVVARQEDSGPFSEDVEEYQWFVPQRYSNPNSSGIEFEVRAGQDNVVKVELTSEHRTKR